MSAILKLSILKEFKHYYYMIVTIDYACSDF